MSVEQAYVERTYDVYQIGPTRVETRSNNCLIRRVVSPRLAAHAQRTTHH